MGCALCRSFVGNCLCIIEPNLYSSPPLWLCTYQDLMYFKQRPYRSHSLSFTPWLYITLSYYYYIACNTVPNGRWFICLYTPFRIRPLSTYTNTQMNCLCVHVCTFNTQKYQGKLSKNRQPTHKQSWREREQASYTFTLVLTQTHLPLTLTGHTYIIITFYQSLFVAWISMDESRQAKRHKCGVCVYNW